MKLSLCNLSLWVNVRIRLFFFFFNVHVICFALSRASDMFTLFSHCHQIGAIGFCSYCLHCLDYLDHLACITYLVVNKTACIWSRIVVWSAVMSRLVNVYLLASLSSWFFFFSLQKSIISETCNVLSWVQWAFNRNPGQIKVNNVTVVAVRETDWNRAILKPGALM